MGINESDIETFPKKRYAYHTTPDIFLNQIIEVGLLPKSESKLSVHPERIYLFMSPDTDIQMSSVLWNATKKEVRDKIKDYYILQIDLSQLPNHKFFNDTDSMISLIAIFTLQAIPSSAIKVIKKIPVSELSVGPTPEEQKKIDDDYEMTMSQMRKSAFEPSPNDDIWQKLLDNMGDN